ncbi:N-acetylglucosamine-1-phosphodiester alpha-N-acetylglucosaminidase-like [Saccostrea cucullata]|uniref:N-acetylglucosamine-1-phosphodiester alpha-N-acetylglucosaminidase-like n=1 Tax=Saccostrea cuccullata TaxID=36930 RepID=UPI002ECFED8B
MNGGSSRKVRCILICNFIINFSIFVICTIQQKTPQTYSDVLEHQQSNEYGAHSGSTSKDGHSNGRKSLPGEHSYTENDGLDILQPYKYHHGPRHRTHRQVRECQDVKYGNVTHSKILSHGFNKNLSLPITETRHLIHVIRQSYYVRRDVLMHFSVINNPFQTVSVLEPKMEHGCKEGEGIRASVLESAKQEDCIVAINAGFFNTTSGACLGNVVSNGRIVQDSGGIQNAHFGITKSGHLYIGYLSEIDLITEDFQQLVGGVLWLIRDGKSYLDESLKIECSDMEETGTLDYFASVMSARTIVGHDKEGRVIFMQADGKTGENGLDLREFIDVMLEYGIVNAINLDGGGSATYTVNGTLVNYPSDQCMDDKKFNCARNVSTVLCAHRPRCPEVNCSGHGACVLGTCHCDKYWTGSKCDQLFCSRNCSGHGKCTKDGCSCDAGWRGDTCNNTCPPGQYGVGCEFRCTCLNGAECDSVSGACHCHSGYTGTFCQDVCPYGYHGDSCKDQCLCDDGCPCHPITGSCNFSKLNTDIQKASVCFSQKKIKEEHLVPDQSSVYRSCLLALIIISVLAVISLLINIVLAYKVYTKKKHKKPRHKKAVLAKSKQLYRFPSSDTDGDLSSLSDCPMEQTSFIKKQKGYS